MALVASSAGVCVLAPLAGLIEFRKAWVVLGCVAIILLLIIVISIFLSDLAARYVRRSKRILYYLTVAATFSIVSALGCFTNCRIRKSRIICLHFILTAASACTGGWQITEVSPRC